MWGALEHRGARHAFLVSNLVLGGIAVLAGLLIMSRKRVRGAG
jgi:hypothetical protein